MNQGDTIITPVKNLLAELAESLSLPAKWKGKDIGYIIKESKHRYFKSRKIQRNKIVQNF